jgi:hypothetical protein
VGGEAAALLHPFADLVVIGRRLRRSHLVSSVALRDVKNCTKLASGFIIRVA